MAENSDSKLIGEIDYLLTTQNSGSTSESNSLEFDDIEGICEQPPVGITPPTYDLRKPDKQSLVRDRARAMAHYRAVGRKLHRQHQRGSANYWRRRYKKSCQLLDYFVEIAPEKNKPYLRKMIQQVKAGKGALI